MSTQPSARFALASMLVLTFSTGISDAVGYLGLDKVFTGNMTGNVVILGMAVASADDLPVLGPLIALAAFMAGAAIGGRVLRGAGAGWVPRATGLLLVVALTFAAGAGLAVMPVEAGSPLGHVLTAMLAAPMGLQACVARHIGVKDVTTVVVTSTVTGLAADSWIARRSGQPWVRRAVAIVAIGAGAGVGALLVRIGLWPGIAASAIIALAVGVSPLLQRAVNVRRARRRPPETS
ncbi:YoaK family protein [Amycolatopsis methanolica]|uniref:YoaK family protein n=1 Tax=Amycolatopsis methanolica TaxID=1814 RepID=UPI00037C7604|nr:YoaK family protein [Amycolatopsis methanolica]